MLNEECYMKNIQISHQLFDAEDLNSHFNPISH
jgi:hypothetical protein